MKRAYLYSASLLLLAAVSCTRDWGSDSPNDEQDSESQIVLRINTPAGFSSGASTRSLSVDDERKIDDIWVLAFNAASELTEIRKGENLKDINATTRSFTATLQRSKNASDTYNLMVLANAETIITNTIGVDIDKITDKSYATIATLLSETIGGKMYASGGTIPMWGESGALEIKLGLNNNISLSLMRAVARIDIGVGSPNHLADGTYKWTGKDNKDNKIPFELQEVYVIKANDRYAVVPGTANIIEKKATAPTVPTGTVQFDIDQSKTHFKFDGAEITASIGEFGSYTTQSIYIPEADVKQGAGAKSGDENHEKRMAVIVGGDYNSSGRTTYYRLDLAKSGDILDALRNHLYQINISKVSGFGYADVETAYKSLSMNMQVDILEWDESDMEDVIFDGQNYFSITKRRVEFSPMGGESETVRIKTNVKSFEMWEAREGGEHLEIKLDGVTTYTNADMGYVYTLTTVTNGSVYDLKIEAKKHNVSNTVPNRLDKWKIKANRLNASFEVDQQYTVLYVSYVNGQSQNLYPEGTTTNTIPIDIMALKPVSIKAEENGITASWIKLGNTDGLSSGKDGLYQARLAIEIDPFVFNASNTTGIRTGTITVTPQDEAPRVFTINQEMPVFKFAKATETVSRKNGSIYHTYVDVITNLQEVDFKIADGTATGTDAWRITRKENLYNVDKTNPRSRRFDVDVDMETKTPMGADAFEKSFTATTEEKYGTITPPVILFQVLQGSNYFDWFWNNAVVPPLVVPYSFPADDNSMKYIFPWQTTSATIHFNSNNGLEYDAANSNNKPRKGTMKKGEDISASEYTTTPYIFTFNKENYNNIDNYDLYFKSNMGATPLTKNIKMGLGVQMWKRNPASAAVDVSYKGYTEAAPYVLNVTSNVDWNAVVTSTDASYIKMRPSATGAWANPPMKTDTRVTAPEIVEAYNAEINLVKTNAMGIAIAPYNTLNATPATREIKLQFVNNSYNAGGAGGGVVIADPVLTLTQYAPMLEYVSGAPTTTVPYYGGLQMIKVTTNLQSWGVRIYLGNDNSGVKLVEKAFGTTIAISDKAPTERTLTIDVPRYNATNDRTISFYLYHAEASVITKEIKLTAQIQSWMDYVIINGLKWKLGNLVAASPTMCTVGAPGDYGLSFQWGGLIGYKNGANGDGAGQLDPSFYGKYWNGAGSFSSNDVAVTPNGYTKGTSMYPHYSDAISGGYGYYYYSNFTTPYADFSKESNGTNVSLGIGDACVNYLGNNWRLPTRQEMAELVGSYDETSIGIPWSTEGIRGRFDNNGPQGSEGAWFGPNSRSGNPTLETDLFVPLSGRRNLATGVYQPHLMFGMLWTSSNSSLEYNNASVHLQISSLSIVPVRSGSRANASSIRCVRSN